MANQRELTTRAYNWAGAERVATGATSAQNADVLGSREILVFATEDTWITFGNDPVAAADTAGNLLLLAGEKYHLQVNPGDKLAAIQDSAAGSLHINPTTTL